MQPFRVTAVPRNRHRRLATGPFGRRAYTQPSTPITPAPYALAVAHGRRRGGRDPSPRLFLGPVSTVLSSWLLSSPAGLPSLGHALFPSGRTSAPYRRSQGNTRDHSGLTLLMTSSPSAAASPSRRRLASVSSPSRLRLVSVWSPSCLRLPATCFPGGEGALPGAVLTASVARLKMGAASAPLKSRRPAAIRVSDYCVAT